MTITISADAHKPHDAYIAVGSGYWGKGESITYAIHQLKKIGGQSSVKKGSYAVWGCSSSTYVNGDGQFCWTRGKGYEPVLVLDRTK